MSTAIHPAKTKAVEYSYPTSDNARRFGFLNTGCHTVETVEGTSVPVAVAGFATREEAIKHAQALPLPWSRLFLKFNPEFSQP